MKATEATEKRARTRAGARAVSLAVALGVLLVLGAFLLVASAPARAYNADPTSAPIEPDPELEGNVTIATHSSGWSTLEYAGNTGGTGNLSAQIDARVPNPIIVSPQDLVASGVVQQEKVPSATTAAYWNSTSYFSKNADSGCTGTDTGPTLATVNGISVVQATQNVTNCGSGYNQNLLYSPTIPVVNYPSANVAFDYVTAIYGLAGPACTGGAGSCYMTASIQNSSAGGSSSNNYLGYSTKTGVQTGGANAAQDEVAPGGFGYYSVSLAQISNAHAGFNTTTGTSYSTGIQLLFSLLLPKSSATTDVYTMTIYAFAFSTQPFTFGTTDWGTSTVQREVAYGNLNLTTFSPSATYQSISGGGFQVGIVQKAIDLPDPTDVSVQANSVNVANYTAGDNAYLEQVTYQFTYNLPTASALTYTGFKLADYLGVAGYQYVSVTFGGTSYTTSYQAYLTHTWYAPASGVNPATAQIWIGIVDYTGPQWDSISTAPSIFSTSGLEYEWFLFLGALLAVGGFSSAWVVRNERNLQVRRGVQPVPGSGLIRLVRWAREGLEDAERSRAESRARMRNGRGTMSAGHGAAIGIGLLLAGAAAVALWSIWDGADATGASAAFFGGFLVLGAVAFIAWVVWEIGRRVRHSRG